MLSPHSPLAKEARDCVKISIARRFFSAGLEAEKNAKWEGDITFDALCQRH